MFQFIKKPVAIILMLSFALQMVPALPLAKAQDVAAGVGLGSFQDLVIGVLDRIPEISFSRPAEQDWFKWRTTGGVLDKYHWVLSAFKTNPFDKASLRSNEPVIPNISSILGDNWKMGSKFPNVSDRFERDFLR